MVVFAAASGILAAVGKYPAAVVVFALFVVLAVVEYYLGRNRQ